jgi:two-component system, OmpR family, phosphate regulon sensor histidine kinase PhoR
LSPLVVRSLLWIFLATCVAFPVGYFAGAWIGWLLFAVMLAPQLINHLRHFDRLDQWSRNPRPDATLEGDGAWDEMFARIYRHEKELHAQIARLDEEIDRFESAGQALTDGVVLLDEHNQISWCNTMAEMQLGLVLESDRGQHIANLVRQPEFIDYLQQQDFSQPLTLRERKGTGRVLSLFVLPYAANKRLMQVKDVTQTDRLDQMRRDFVANVSHELRTPLTVLAGFVETLQEFEVDRDESKRYLGMMAEQSGRMQNIVKDLLTLSSLESAPPPDDEVIDMASLLDKLRRDAQALSAGRHQITFETDGQGDLRGSEMEIASALGNLVTNAVRYTPEGGTVSVRWKVQANGAVFTVQDTGIGIEPAHIPRLTERFYRVDRGRSRDSGGTGLGLAIVKHSLNRHQAHLLIDSEPGRGSVFSVTFPPKRLVAW